MSKPKMRRMTNVEKLTHIMEFSKHGAMMQLVVMEGLRAYSEEMSKKTSSDFGANGLICMATWIATCKELKEFLEKEEHLTPDLEPDDSEEDNNS